MTDSTKLRGLAEAALTEADSAKSEQILTELIENIKQAVGPGQKEIAAELQRLSKEMERDGKTAESFDFKQRTCALMLMMDMRARGRDARTVAPAAREGKKSESASAEKRGVLARTTSSQVLIGRLERGSDIIQSIEQICAENGVSLATVQMIGAVGKATISYYDQVEHKYFTRDLAGEYEIVSCSGNISIKDDKPFAHLHVVFSGTDYNCVAGHLMPGTTEVFACEFVLQVLSGDRLVRRKDADTGLFLWS